MDMTWYYGEEEQAAVHGEIHAEAAQHRHCKWWEEKVDEDYNHSVQEFPHCRMSLAGTGLVARRIAKSTASF